MRVQNFFEIQFHRSWNVARLKIRVCDFVFGVIWHMWHYVWHFVWHITLCATCSVWHNVTCEWYDGLGVTDLKDLTYIEMKKLDTCHYTPIKAKDTATWRPWKPEQLLGQSRYSQLAASCHTSPHKNPKYPQRQTHVRQPTFRNSKRVPRQDLLTYINVVRIFTLPPDRQFFIIPYPYTCTEWPALSVLAARFCSFHYAGFKSNGF